MDYEVEASEVVEQIDKYATVISEDAADLILEAILGAVKDTVVLFLIGVLKEHGLDLAASSLVSAANRQQVPIKILSENGSWVGNFFNGCSVETEGDCVYSLRNVATSLEQKGIEVIIPDGCNGWRPGKYKAGKLVRLLADMLE